MRGGAVGSGALIASPTFAASVGLLLLNDHLLKAAWPGFVTGKLSDVAGVAMVAIALTAVVSHRAVAFAFTAVTFAALKTVPAAAAWAAPVLGGVTRTDPTDLGALLILVPLWPWVGRRAARDRNGDPGRGWRTLPVQAVLIGCAVLATTATSSDCDSAGVYRVGAVDGVAYAMVDDGGTRIHESRDGGRTWRAVPVSDERWRDSDPWPIGEPCHEGPSCLLAPGAPEREVLRDLDPAKNDSCWSEFGLDSVVVERPDGEHRIETMGALGVVHRSPDGVWEWVAVGESGLRPHQVDDEPFGIEVASTLPDDTITRSLRRLVPVMIIAAPIALAVWVLPLRRIARRRGREPTGAVAVSIALAVVSALVGVGALVLLAAFSSSRDSSRLFAITVGLIWLGTATTTIVGTYLYHRRPKPQVEAPPFPPPPNDQRVG